MGHRIIVRIVGLLNKISSNAVLADIAFAAVWAGAGTLIKVDQIGMVSLL